MTEYLLVGWEQIHKMLCDEHGNPAISLSTLRQTYGPDMKRLGVVFEFHIGRGKRPSICAWPSRIMWYFTARQIEKYKAD
jgi:hypothetical protein